MSPRAKSATNKAKPATTRKRKKKIEAGSVGLSAREVAGIDAGIGAGTGAAPAAVAALVTRIDNVGGAVLARYREPFGGFWVVLAALPLDQIKPTPYQRELSKAHAEKLAAVIPKVGRFLDPVIAVADPDGDGFITPNGMHRLSALGTLGAKAIVALVMPEPELAFRILALNTEKAHNLKDKALEVIRMARAVAKDPRKTQVSEADLGFELEQAALVTLGVCYERNARFSGGAYNPIVSKTEQFATVPMKQSLKLREAHAERLLELDEEVADAVERLKKAGFSSGYLKPIVIARINPLRFLGFGKPKSDKPPAPPDFDRTIDKMLEGAKKFDPSKVRAQDVAIAAAVGGSDEH